MMKESIRIDRGNFNIDIDQVVGLLHKSEWAANRMKEEIRRSIENSTCYTIYDGEKLIGFARIITDFVTTFYLMDVIIDKEYRGKGLGKRLMDEIMKDVGHLYGVLHTEKAQKFYESYGFKVTATSETGESIMEKQKGREWKV